MKGKMAVEEDQASVKGVAEVRVVSPLSPHPTG